MIIKKLLFILKLINQNIKDLIFDDFLLIDGILYKKFSDVPYNGEKKSSNGKYKFWMLTNYKNGLAHGLHKRFFLDGSVMETGIYKKGLREGEWKGYYPDGSIDYTLTKTYKDGKDINHYICKQFENRR